MYKAIIQNYHIQTHKKVCLVNIYHVNTQDDKANHVIIPILHVSRHSSSSATNLKIMQGIVEINFHCLDPCVKPTTLTKQSSLFLEPNLHFNFT